MWTVETRYFDFLLRTRTVISLVKSVPKHSSTQMFWIEALRGKDPGRRVAAIKCQEGSVRVWGSELGLSQNPLTHAPWADAPGAVWECSAGHLHLKHSGQVIN